MAGHSKWANIKRRKASQDATKNKERTRLIRDILVAVRENGTTNNHQLQLAIQQAKRANVPKSKIEQAVERGMSKETSTERQEWIYEAYAPSGVALIIEVLSDNKNRTISAVRSILTKHGGKLAGQNALSHLFIRKKSFILSPTSKFNWEELLLNLIDSGVDEFEQIDNKYYFSCPLSEAKYVENFLKDFISIIEKCSVDYIPQQEEIRVETSKRQKIEKLLEALEIQEDISAVYQNMKITS